MSFPTHGLTFLSGPMGSAKTASLLIKHHALNNRRIQGEKPALLVRPALDTRSTNISSRIQGLSHVPDIVLQPADDLKQFPQLTQDHVTDVLVEEAQFLSVPQVEQLSYLSLSKRVYCVGLRTTWKGELWAASKRLFELADTLQETEHPCAMCRENKAIFNMRLVPMAGTGDVQIGGDESYAAVCRKCYDCHNHIE